MEHKTTRIQTESKWGALSDTLISLCIIHFEFYGTKYQYNDIKKNTSSSFWRIFELSAVDFVLGYNYKEIFVGFQCYECHLSLKRIRNPMNITPTKKKPPMYRVVHIKSLNVNQNKKKKKNRKRKGNWSQTTTHWLW